MSTKLIGIILLSPIVLLVGVMIIVGLIQQVIHDWKNDRAISILIICFMLALIGLPLLMLGSR